MDDWQRIGPCLIDMSQPVAQRLATLTLLYWYVHMPIPSRCIWLYAHVHDIPPPQIVHITSGN